MTEEIEVNLSPSKFIRELEEFVARTNESYIDAIVHLCAKNNIEIESAAGIVKNSIILKTKVQGEAEDLNYLPKKAKLPI